MDEELRRELLARHADRDQVRWRAFPDALRGAVDQGEAFSAHLAYLDDQVVYCLRRS